MEREEIVREDFPSARKGWDPEAVKAHLNALAERLPKGSGSIGEVAADRVGKIVGVAEATAAEIEAEAGKQAEAIVAAARGEAEEIISRARSEAQARIEQAQKAVESLVEQAEDLRGKVGSLGESLAGEVRTRVSDTTGSGDDAEPEPGAPEPEIEETQPASEPAPVASRPDEAAELAAVAAPDPSAEQSKGDADRGAIRLVAMNLALEGAERDAIAVKLEAEFGEVNDRDGLIDDVLARAGRS